MMGFVATRKPSYKHEIDALSHADASSFVFQSVVCVQSPSIFISFFLE